MARVRHRPAVRCSELTDIASPCRCDGSVVVVQAGGREAPAPAHPGELLAHVVPTDTPADDGLRKDLDDERDVGKSLPGRDEREISDPELVGPLRGELPRFTRSLGFALPGSGLSWAEWTLT